VFVVMTLQGNQKLHASLGRFCYVAFMVLVAYVSYRVFRAKGGILESVLTERPTSWLSRLQRGWRVCIFLSPLFLAVLSIAGFYYTSQRLAEYLLQTVALVFGLTVLGAMLYRWVRLKRRQLRWQQAMEHRERQSSGEATEASKIAEIAVVEEEVDLAAIDQQTRRLVRSFLLFAGLVGMWLIWANVIPMLGLLEQRDVWAMKDAAGEPSAITVADILMAIVVMAVTVASARNIPGLVDILLLERLQIESSIRYAVSTLSQYFIAILGIVIAATTLGFSWSKVQWLVAAMGVGLGFGLQEIVANFVCGLILLFERPIRVGDVVTLGDASGVVTKISIRATRIRNWDRQELVIPNKELITGRIVNWTLTDKLNRVVLTVGVAYGSDTRRARELIFEILRDQPNVLDEPTPLVIFETFGDSTLNFTIRAYLSTLDQRLETVHELHTLIHERFNAEGIVIAFPQLDLHVKSIEQTLGVIRHADLPTSPTVATESELGGGSPGE
jgi:potassium efflux system protein